MTKKLSELFNLPDDGDDSNTDSDAAARVAEQRSILAEVDLAIDKIDAALPMVRDLEADDQDLDELAQLAKEKFNELMDLGFNIEPRYSSEILSTASSLLGHAITAKTAKMDKKLRMIQLQLAKAKLDQSSEKTNDVTQAIDGQGVVLDRNELLKAILKKNSGES